MSNGPGPAVESAIMLMSSLLNLPDGQVIMKFLGNSNYRRTVINPAHQKKIFSLIKMTLGHGITRYVI